MADLSPRAHTQAVLKRMNLAASVPGNLDRNNDANGDNYGLSAARSSDASSFKMNGAPKSPHMGRPGRQSGGRVSGQLVRTRRTPEETAKDIADEDKTINALAKDRVGRAHGGRTKGRTTVNVIIGGQKALTPPPMQPPPPMGPGPGGPPPPPPPAPGVPMGGGGMPMGGMPMMPAGGAPMGAAGAPPPGAPPMPRARGGRVGRQTGGGVNIPGNVWNNAQGQTPLWASNPLAAGVGNPQWNTDPSLAGGTPTGPFDPTNPATWGFGTGPGQPGTLGAAPPPSQVGGWGNPAGQGPPAGTTPPRSGTTGGGQSWQTIGLPGDPNTPGWNGPPAKEVFFNGTGYNVPMDTSMSQLGTGPGQFTPSQLPPWGLKSYGPDNPMPKTSWSAAGLGPPQGYGLPANTQLLPGGLGATLAAYKPANNEGPGTGINAPINVAGMSNAANTAMQQANNASTQSPANAAQTQQWQQQSAPQSNAGSPTPSGQSPYLGATSASQTGASGQSDQPSGWGGTSPAWGSGSTGSGSNSWSGMGAAQTLGMNPMNAGWNRGSSSTPPSSSSNQPASSSTPPPAQNATSQQPPIGSQAGMGRASGGRIGRQMGGGMPQMAPQQRPPQMTPQMQALIQARAQQQAQQQAQLQAALRQRALQGAPPLRASGGRIEVETTGKHDYGKAGVKHGKVNEEYGAGSGLGRQERARRETGGRIEVETPGKHTYPTDGTHSFGEGGTPAKASFKRKYGGGSGLGRQEIAKKEK